MASLQALFDALVDLDPAQRALRLAALDPASANAVRALLDADARAVPLLERPLAAALEALRDDDDALLRSLVGTRIGSFRLVELVGQGGSAAVFRAERPAGAGTQRVALKLLRTGLCSHDAQQRFLREHAILARLSHPDIARLVEGGVSDAGIPYIAMELVAGAPITRAADEAALGLGARLRLFLRLCRAVQAAHAQLVVHCDLKPANILVEPAGGALKVLDFGIASLVGVEPVHDAPQSLALTPEYAAPEQLRREPPSVAIDVHALGVILGELLTGVRLRGGARRTATTALAAAPLHEPPRGLPSRARLVRALRGDLDAIVDTALEPDAQRRYRSAEALARDVERWLDGLPVHARAAPRLERAAKLVRRHRVAAAAALIAVAGLLASTAVALVQSVEARREAAAARAASVRAESLRAVLVDAFGEAVPSAPRDGPATVVDAVERALAGSATNAIADARVRLELRAELGGVLSAQGAHARAAQVFEDAIALAASELAADDALRFELEWRAAKNLADQGEWRAARARLDELLPRIPDDALVVRAAAATTSAWLAGRLRERNRAKAESEAALALARASGDARRIEQALRARGTVLLDQGEGARAVPVYEDLLARQRARYGDVHARVAAEHAALSRALRNAGELARAEEHARAAIAIDDRVYPPLHWHRALHLNALAMVQIQRRDFEAALGTTREQDRIQVATLPADHPDTYGTWQSRGVLHGHLGELEVAELWTRRAVEGYDRIGMAPGWWGVRARGTHAYALARLGRRAEAEAVLAEAERLAPPDLDPNVLADLAERRVRIALDADDTAAARAAYSQLESVAHASSLQPAAAPRHRVLGAEILLREHAPERALAALAPVQGAIVRLAAPEPVLATHTAVLEAIAIESLGDPERAAAARDAAHSAFAALRHPPFHVSRDAARLGLAEAD